MRHLTGTLILIALLASGCVRSTQFHCEDSAECGTGGLCESDGLCSVASSSCASGREYAPSSGKEGTCVGDNGGEAGNENPGNEMPGGEPPPMGCRADYMVLPNSGTRGHRYFLIDTTGTWPVQRDACLTNMGFMAFPDGPQAAMELSAVVTFGGAGLWMGVNDIGGNGQEGKYKNSLGMNASTQTQALITESGNSNNEDCLAGTATTMTDEDCTNARKTVCECVP